MPKRAYVKQNCLSGKYQHIRRYY